MTNNYKINKLQQLEIQKSNFPEVAPLTETNNRPFWSVMITAYKRTEYLEQAIRSVLDQDIHEHEMQIEVVDDCSPPETAQKIEKIVQEVGKGRVAFYRQPHNVGIYANWNTCINRARGHWVHILHDDDLVMPGFYRRLQKSLEQESNVGAAFCRHAYIDEEGNWQFLSKLERRTPGILSDWLERIAVVQAIQCPSIVVKRSTYEKLGGFYLKLCWSNDWEMWKRIAMHYPVWYEPQLLACYRLHSSSESSQLTRSGANIADIRCAINFSRSYFNQKLPRESVEKLSNMALSHYAYYAINDAKKFINKGDSIAATNQIKQALLCSASIKIFCNLLLLILRIFYQAIIFGFQLTKARISEGKKYLFTSKS
ncbi:glycosyltransferase family 2 protein [Pleurocapsales cyanobacterium LEGE 06147]|nr:glycosyltransferase family 2 protein [Pleurocapsales cyanobacterium LEGE 06147]